MPHTGIRLAGGNDDWLEQQLEEELSQSAGLEKLVRLEQFKISQAKLRVSKVQEGWEKGFYSSKEVQSKLNEHREAVDRAESEIKASWSNGGLWSKRS